MRAVGKTHIGMLRNINQDSYACINSGHFVIMAIADGMGGHNAGEVASSIAAEHIENYFKNSESDNYFEKSGEIESLVHKINHVIHEQSLSSDECAGMGTTLTLCISDGNFANIYHIGDSRAYLLNDRIVQVTKDHSLVQFLIDQGQLTKQEAEHHPRKNVITRALGTDDEIEVDCFTIVLQPGDRLLLCSDGLTNMVGNEEILSIVNNNNIDLSEAVDMLVSIANEHGGSDNITVILAEREGGT